MKTDIAVIGTGLSALAAARTIQQSGRQVVLVWPGLSSLYFLFATVDVLGYPTADATEPVADPGGAVARLIEREPTHPYARAGIDAVRASTRLMLEWFKQAGLAWEGGLDRNFLLPTPNETFASFQRAVGHPIFEIPTVPPSVIALRLFDRLRKHLQESGIEIIWSAPAHAAQVTDGRCRNILLKAAGHELPLEAAAYVVALEDWVDGAFRAGVHTVRDPFFHRPLAWNKVPTDRTAESLFSTQPFEQVGYALTERLQPADENGRAIAQNVFCAGGAIAGYDPSGTKSRGGMAIATGYRAAREAVAA